MLHLRTNSEPVATTVSLTGSDLYGVYAMLPGNEIRIYGVMRAENHEHAASPFIRDALDAGAKSIEVFELSAGEGSEFQAWASRQAHDLWRAMDRWGLPRIIELVPHIPHGYKV